MDQLQKIDVINYLLDHQSVDEDWLWKATKTDKSSISQLNKELEEFSGAYIKNRNNNYELIINNTEVFNRYYEELKVKSGFYNTQEDRINYIIEKLLIETKYVKIEDLADELYISQRQISNYLKTVRSFFEHYHLCLNAVPHYGLILEGNELKRRMCLADLLSRNIISYGKNSLNISEKETVNEIREIVNKVIEELNYPMEDFIFENLVIHLFIAVVRISFNARIEFSQFDDIREEDKKAADRIVSEIEKRFSIHFSESECNYIMAHLISKRSYRNGDSAITVPVEVGDLVIDVLNKIDKEFNRNFRSDFQLCMTLSLHFMPLLHRIRFGFKQNNPMLNEIKQKYLYEFEMAEVGLQIINQRYDTQISEDEIAYIALDLRMSIENRYDKTKEKILLVCSSGKGSAELLKMQITQYLHDYIETIELCSLREISRVNLNDYDHIFTTIPLHVNTSTPVFMISHFLGNEDINRISSFLRFGDSKETVMRYFDKRLFMGIVDAKNKNELIRKMTDHIEKYVDIPDHFFTSVMDREKIANTSFGNMIAFPHPKELQTDTTFVCVAICKEPVLWNEKDKVQLILLASIEKNPNKELSDFYKAVTKLANNSGNIKRLICNPEYETLHKILVNE